MGEAKVGEEFVTHEYDEAIAVQQCIVDAETKLSTKHPVGSAKTAIKARSAEDKDVPQPAEGPWQAARRDRQGRGRRRGPEELMEETLETATEEGADSDYYEAHAVLLNIKRKQMDSAGGMLEIARATKDTELRKAATAFAKAQKASCQVLADELAAYAAKIASHGQGRLNRRARRRRKSTWRATSARSTRRIRSST